MKIQVFINDNLVKRIDNVCKNIGISRSAFCAIMIANGFYKIYGISENEIKYDNNDINK